jgi:hypothetical protein
VHAGEQHPLVSAGPPKAIPLLPVQEPPLVASPAETEAQSAESSRSEAVSMSCSDVDSSEAIQHCICQGQGDKERDGPCDASDGSHVPRPPLKELPGLVPRPLTLPQAVAKALTEAAHKQGSNDNLAAVVVDLMGPRRFSPPSAAILRDSRGAANVSGMQDGEGRLADLLVPRRSTAMCPSSIIQGGDWLHVCQRMSSCLPTAFHDLVCVRRNGMHVKLIAACIATGASHQYKLKELLALVPRGHGVSAALSGSCSRQPEHASTGRQQELYDAQQCDLGAIEQVALLSKQDPDVGASGSPSRLFSI